jgi:hypothetical protein
MGTGPFPWVESGLGVTLTTHPLLVPRSINRVEVYLYSPIPLLSLRAFVACETYLVIRYGPVLRKKYFYTCAVKHLIRGRI